MSDFTYQNYTAIFERIQTAGYRFVTLADYFSGAADSAERIVVNRIDVDVKVDRLRVLRQIFARLGVHASIYIRLHAPGYNALNFGTLQQLRGLAGDGHEIGLHTELMDAEGFLAADGGAVLRAETALLESLLDIRIRGTASHGDITPHNNLHFWRTHAPADFGLEYEAYDARLWDHCRYVCDSEWTRWKSYNNGRLLEGDRRPPDAHAAEDAPPVIYLLTHPESWYDHYVHE